MSGGCALFMTGFKGQGHNALNIENGFWRITALHLQSSNFTQRFPVSQGYASMNDIRVKNLDSLNWLGGYLSR